MSVRVSAKVRKLVEERARGLCEYCLSPLNHSTHNFSIEHILPKVKGGTNAFENLALACQGCNGYKYDKTVAQDPISKKIVPLYHPRLHRWREHFDWSSDYSNIVGISATGRATVKMLRLNREGVVNLRNLLRKDKKHPPKQND